MTREYGDYVVTLSGFRVGANAITNDKKIKWITLQEFGFIERFYDGVLQC